MVESNLEDKSIKKVRPDLSLNNRKYCAVLAFDGFVDLLN